MESFNIFLQPPAPLVGGAIGTQEFPGRSNTYSAEVRLASKATNPLQWITGAYFFKENNVGPICVRGTYLATTCAFQEGPNNNNISYAAFAQTTYTPAVLGDKLHLVLGARFNSDEITHSDFENAAFFPLIGKANINRPYLNKTAQKGTYKAGINYDLAPDSLLYVSNSTGYRAFNFQYGEDPYVPPESIHAWNVGSKNLFFDRRLQVNLDAFLYDYFGQERSVQTYPPPQAPFLPFSDITAFSTGEIRYKGASVDLMAAVTANDRVSLSVHYVDATYTDFVLPARFKNTIAYTLQGVPTGQVGNYTGTPVSQVAPWSGTAGYDHDWHFAGGTLTAQLAAQFANETPMADAVPGTLQDVVRPSYVTGDVLLRFASSDDRWTISAWCRNVSNKITWNSAGYGTTTGAAQGGLVTALLNPPRTYGLTFSIKTGNP
jgi:iron complex outermembrane receptor protein